MHSYKMMLSKELCKRDIETRRALCLEIQQHVLHATAVLFSDEAHFLLRGTVNKQNFSLEKSPRELHGRPLHCPQVTVWCGWQNSVYGVHTSSKKTLQ